MKIIKGDITQATEDVILHQVNCQNVMGSGVAYALYTKWPSVKTYYHNYCEMMAKIGYGKPDLLGSIVPVEVGTNIVINCFSQLTYGNDGRQHTDYKAVKDCFWKVYCTFPDQTIAIPYGYGCGLGGEDWKIVSEIIKVMFGDRAVIYKL